MAKYKIETPSKKYTKDYLGIKFKNGIGYTDSDKLAGVCKSLGYAVITEEVEVVEDKVEAPNYEEMTSAELKDIAKEKELTGYSKLNKTDLIALITGAE